MTQTPPTLNQSPDRAWRSVGAQAFFWIIVFMTTAFDLASKWWAFKTLKVDEVLNVVPNFLQFYIVRNPGAVFGMGAGKRWLFIGASLVAMFFIFQLFSQSRKNQHGFHFLLGLTLGGALGNLYDRVTVGTVRDFIHLSVSFGNFKLWPWVFNIADVALVVGVLGLLLGWMLGKFDITGTVPVARPVNLNPTHDQKTMD
jgi:signal peptidase II